MLLSFCLTLRISPASASLTLTGSQRYTIKNHDASSLPNASQSIGTNSLSIGPILNCLAAKPYHKTHSPQSFAVISIYSRAMKSQGRLHDGIRATASRTCYTRGPAVRRPESGYSIH